MTAPSDIHLWATGWRRLLLPILLAGTATLVTLWGAELAVGSLASRRYEDRLNEIVERAGRTPDRRSRLEVVRDLRKSDSTAVPNMWALAFLDVARRSGGPEPELLPLSGRGGALTVLCNEGDGWRTFSADHHGFANPDSAWDDSVNVMLVGDSYAMGQCVRTNETPMALLREKGRKGLTVGNSSNGPLISFATFREYVEPVRPKHVIWLFFQNDIDELQTELREAQLLAYLDEDHGQKLMARRAARDSALDAVIANVVDGTVARDVSAPWSRRVRGVLTLYSLRQIAGRTFGRARPLDDRSRDALTRMLTETRDRTKAWGGDLTIVYLPSWEQFKLGSPNGDTLRATLAREAKALDVPMLDATTAIRANDVWASFPLGEAITAHYSALGNLRLAGALSRMLDSLDRIGSSVGTDRREP